MKELFFTQRTAPKMLFLIYYSNNPFKNRKIFQ